MCSGIHSPASFFLPDGKQQLPLSYLAEHPCEFVLDELVCRDWVVELNSAKGMALAES